MKRLLFLLFLTATLRIGGYAQSVIEPLLSEEMERRNDDEKIEVVVIMKSQYDRAQMNLCAESFVTRAERREFVVNELKEFAIASQYDLKHLLAEMEQQDMVSAPTTLWMANALYFNANQTAIRNLAERHDIARIGYSIERNWIPDEEKALPTSDIRGITPNVLQVRANEVWDLGFRGEGVVVAVVDSGVNYNHVDVADHLWDGGEEFPNHGYDVRNDDNDPMDDHGHGSHCAGIVCGDGTAGSQTGMAPEATLMCVKCFSASYTGVAASLAEGVQWAVEHGCDVLSISAGYVNPTAAERMLLRRTCEATLDAGVVAAIAIGNEGNDLSTYPIPYNVRVPGSCPPPYMDEVQGEFPGGLSCSVCVGAVDYNDHAAYFTSHGPTTWQYSEFDDYYYNPGIGLIRPDMCAPGVDIKSLQYNSNNGYINMTGTSMATPCVAGCMALMLSKDPNLTPADLCRILEETAVPLAEGKSNTYGFGRVDALAAVDAVPLGGIRYQSFAIDDSMGNNNDRLNPGESVTMSLTLKNIFDEPINGVSAVLTTQDEYVTISQDTVVFPDFAAYETHTIDNAFAFSVDNQVVSKQKVRLTVNVYVDGELTGRFNDMVIVYDYLLQYGVTAIVNDANGDGFLNPGETADLRIMIDNRGNEMVQGVMGTLSTENTMVTLNETQKSFGTLGAEMAGYADFSATLNAAAADDMTIPFSLDLMDAFGRHTELIFNYKNACKVIFSLRDSFNDGWQDNYLQVDYSDGTPSEQMTLDHGGSIIYTRELGITSTITLNWHTGQWQQECSFEIAYEDGEVIFQNSGGFTGPLTFTISCIGGYDLPEFCEPIRGLDYETNGCQVALTWDAPENAIPTAYNVYRETVLVGTTTEFSVTDTIGEGIYDYCVYAVYDDCQSEYVCQEVEVRNEAPEIHIAEVREGLIATAWNAVEGAIAYNLYRNGELIAENLTETAYNDTEMALNAQHCYMVASVYEKGVSDASEAACANYYLGLDENDSKVNIFPNPTSGKVTVQCAGMTKLEIYSSDGKLVESVKVKGDVYQMEGMESGSYTVLIRRGEETLIRKIVKQ